MEDLCWVQNQLFANLRKPPETSPNLEKPRKTSVANLRKPRETSENLRKPISQNLRKPRETSANLRKPRKTVIGLLRFLEVFLGLRTNPCDHAWVTGVRAPGKHEPL